MKNVRARLNKAALWCLVRSYEEWLTPGRPGCTIVLFIGNHTWLGRPCDGLRKKGAERMTTAADWMYGKITDEALATLRSRCGQTGPMSPPSDPYTRTQIIRYLAAAGDDNPLFWDEAYAARTRW